MSKLIRKIAETISESLNLLLLCLDLTFGFLVFQRSFASSFEPFDFLPCHVCRPSFGARRSQNSVLYFYSCLIAFTGDVAPSSAVLVSPRSFAIAAVGCGTVPLRLKLYQLKPFTSFAKAIEI
jgi:hypothetical protein